MGKYVRFVSLSFERTMHTDVYVEKHFTKVLWLAALTCCLKKYPKFENMLI